MKAKVLNVNDDPATLYTLSTMLRRADFEVQEATSGIEALASLRTTRPDVVVLDVRLPDLNGIEVCRRIKSDEATTTIPVLLTSAAFITTGHRVQGLNEGADAYLVQPVEPIELVAVINALLRARRAEEQLALSYAREREARQQAEHAARLRDDFLAAVSHELRTPLNAILGWATLLQRGPFNREKLDRGMAIIERNTRVQTQLINDLLDVSRIITGKFRLARRRTALAAVLEAARDSIQSSADARGVQLLVSIPALGQLLVDPDRMQQVFWNLLSNAVKFTPTGGHVWVEGERHPDHVEIRVRDDGRGIDKAFLPFVFETFAQAEGGATRTHGGLGLGLAIVRHLVELHGGSVEAQSEGQGRGATFLVRLPDLDESTPPSTHVLGQAVEGTPSSRQSLRGVTVLVVDPDTDTRELLVLILEQEGMVVLSAATRQEAIRLSSESRPRAAIVAVKTPEESGQLLLDLRALLDDGEMMSLPALAISAEPPTQGRLRWRRVGYQLHLPKPLDPNDLVVAVARLLNWGASWMG